MDDLETKKKKTGKKKNTRKTSKKPEQICEIRGKKTQAKRVKNPYKSAQSVAKKHEQSE